MIFGRPRPWREPRGLEIPLARTNRTPPNADEDSADAAMCREDEKGHVPQHKGGPEGRRPDSRRREVRRVLRKAQSNGRWRPLLQMVCRAEEKKLPGLT